MVSGMVPPFGGTVPPANRPAEGSCAMGFPGQRDSPAGAVLERLQKRAWEWRQARHGAYCCRRGIVVPPIGGTVSCWQRPARYMVTPVGGTVPWGPGAWRDHPLELGTWRGRVESLGQAGQLPGRNGAAFRRHGVPPANSAAVKSCWQRPARYRRAEWCRRLAARFRPAEGGGGWCAAGPFGSAGCLGRPFGRPVSGRPKARPAWCRAERCCPDMVPPIGGTVCGAADWRHGSLAARFLGGTVPWRHGSLAARFLGGTVCGAADWRHGMPPPDPTAVMSRRAIARR